MGASLVLPSAVTEQWREQRTQIFPAEAIALPIALAWFCSLIQGRDVIAFCDNASAVSALIRMSSKSEDVQTIAELFTVLCLKAECRCWVDWVDSESNPADGLSRAGVHDRWTLAQGWELAEPKALPALTGEPFSDFFFLSTSTLGFCLNTLL